VISIASGDFWKCFDRLPAAVQSQAKKQFELFQSDPHHPSLHFKELKTGILVSASQQELSSDGQRGRRKAELVLDRFTC
jgi:hypothetical protein